MNNFSTTQINNIATFSGLLAIILAKLGIAISSEELQVTIGLVVSIVANIANYIHRYQKGDLTMGGLRK